MPMQSSQKAILTNRTKEGTTSDSREKEGRNHDRVTEKGFEKELSKVQSKNMLEEVVLKIVIT